MAKKHIKFWSLLLALVMVMSLLPMSALAEDSSNGLELSKSVSDPDASGIYTLTLDAYTTGTVTTSTQATPVDIVLVLDQSGSMQ